jgi:zinc transport system substrate-binding protein
MSKIFPVLLRNLSIRHVFVCLFILSVLGCSSREGADHIDADDESGPLTVYTVNYPLQYFAERIAGNAVDVHFPAAGEDDPAYWQPSAESVAAYQQADMILLNGAGYAKWTQTASLPSSRSVNTSAGFRDKWIPLEETVTHSHGAGGEHSHRGFAFPTWLDPHLAVLQARAIRDALVARRPAMKASFEEDHAALEKDLDLLNGQMRQSTQELSDIPVLFSHPVYQYFERQYELDGKSLHWEPGELPSENAWTDLDALLAEHPATLMIWEGAPHAGAVAKLKERGIVCVVFEPCGNKPDEGDFLTVMRDNIERLGKAAANVSTE